MSMYKFGIRASSDPFKNREIISFIESLGYENKIKLDGSLGTNPDPDSVYAAGRDEDNKVHCTVDRYCCVVYDSLEKAKEYLCVPNKEIKITVPKGYEIDKENSTFECIKFKKKQLTYEDVAKKLFTCKECFYPDIVGIVRYISNLGTGYDQPNNCTSRKQAEKLLAINKLMNVAKYLNDGWEPDWDNISEYKYFINGNLGICQNCMFPSGINVYFKTENLAKQAIEILGEETIKLALCTDY